MIAKRISMAAAAFAAALTSQAAPAAAQSANVVAQGPCSTGANPCVTFRAFPPYAPVTVRSIELTSPITGTAVLTFHGSLECLGDDTPTNDRLVILQSQIVATHNNAPDGLGTSGLFLRSWIPYIHSHAEGGGADSFNLASTRAITVTEGQQMRYALKIGLTNLQPDVECRASRSSAFTVTFFE